MEDVRTEAAARRIGWAALLAVTAAVSFLFFTMVKGFLIALILAAITSVLAKPLQARMTALTRGRSAIAAVFTLIVLAFSVIAPLFIIAWLAVAQAQGLSGAAAEIVREIRAFSPDAPLPDWIPFREELARYGAVIAAKAGEFATSGGQFLVGQLTNVTTGTLRFFIDVAIFFYALFFFVQMKQSMIAKTLAYSGLPTPLQAKLKERVISISRATFKGTLLIGLAQGALGGLSFWVAGIDSAIFWGVVMAILSVIPGVGPLLVILGGAAWLFSQGETVFAIGLIIWGVAVVGSIDNILRPILVGRDTAMPDLLILISTLGGLGAFGATGLILGPVVAGLFIALWDTVRLALEQGMDDDASKVDATGAASSD